MYQENLDQTNENNMWTLSASSYYFIAYNRTNEISTNLGRIFTLIILGINNKTAYHLWEIQ